MASSSAAFPSPTSTFPQSAILLDHSTGFLMIDDRPLAPHLKVFSSPEPITSPRSSFRLLFAEGRPFLTHGSGGSAQDWLESGQPKFLLHHEMQRADR